MGTGIEMAEFVIEFPNGEVEKFNSNVEYKYAVVERCGAEKCECENEWVVARKSKSWKNAKDAMYAFDFGPFNRFNNYQYEVVSIKEVVEVNAEEFEVEIYEFVMAVSARNEKASQEFYRKFAEQMFVKYGVEWFEIINRAYSKKVRAGFNKVA